LLHARLFLIMSPMRLAWFLVFVACGGSQRTVDPAQPPADTAPCADVAAHELAVMSVGFIGSQRTGDMQRKIEGHCRTDAWPLAARRCVLTANSFDEMSACHDQLTATQRTAFQRDLRGSAEPAVPDQPPPPPELLK
jgi:hypothetical protein